MAKNSLQRVGRTPDRTLHDALVDNFRPEHVTSVLSAVSKVLEARVEAGMLELKTTLRIRETMQKLKVDTLRAQAAADLYERMRQDLDVGTRSEIAALIIKVQLGVSP